jgi:hypothetical protein
LGEVLASSAFRAFWKRSNTALGLAIFLCVKSFDLNLSHAKTRRLAKLQWGTKIVSQKLPKEKID